MWRGAWTILKETLNGFVADDVMSKAAALALYIALGLAPTVLLLLAATAFLGADTQQVLVNRVAAIVGSQAAKGFTEVVRTAKHEQEQWASGTFSAIIGLATVLVSATGIFAQLQNSLNDIWGIAPKRSGFFWSWLRARLLSVAALFLGLLLLLASLVASAVVAMAVGQSDALWKPLNMAISLSLYLAVFALIFKLLPDARIRWRDVWIGAATTTLLFAIGKYMIGLYLGRSALASSYGAAGSLVALIIWVYYSAIIVFLGAEVTASYAHRYGSGITPYNHAMWKQEKAGRHHPSMQQAK